MAQFCHLKYFWITLYFCWTARSVFSQNSDIERTTFVDSSYFFYQRPDYPRDCSEVRSRCSTSNLSGVYLIKPDGYPEPFEVYCNNAIDTGAWTVIQRFQDDGSLLFNRNWTEYKSGFGFLSQEFWIGNDKLASLINQDIYELRIDFTSANGLSFYVTYNRFRISDEFGEYKLTSVGEYNGTEDKITMFLCPSGSDGNVFISPDCSRQCSCNRGQFSCEDHQCSHNAVCEERDNGPQCYCKAGYTGDGVNCTIDTPPSDCQDVYERGSTDSGVYTIKPTTWQREPFDVYCNMTDGGGWTVFQRRVDGSQDFFLYWSDYKDGFGRPEHESWLGNDKLHSLTSQRNYQLRVDIVNSLGDPYYAKYSSFSISDENDKYRLSVSGYSGNAGDAMTSSYTNNGQAFTTRDRDNDDWTSGNCATWYGSHSYCDSSCNVNAGWWYNNCGNSYLNSPYGTDCFVWRNLPGSYCNLKYTEMKVRPI